jgi:hypothetical protein
MQMSIGTLCGNERGILEKKNLTLDEPSDLHTWVVESRREPTPWLR